VPNRPRPRTPRTSGRGRYRGSRPTAKGASVADGALRTGWSGWTGTPRSGTRPTATLITSRFRRGYRVISPQSGPRGFWPTRAVVGRRPELELTARGIVSYADRCAVGSRVPRTERV